QDYVDINVLGRSDNIYLRGAGGASKPCRVWPRLGIVLGLIYLLGFVVMQWALTTLGRPGLVVFQGLGGSLLILAAACVLPASAFFQSPFHQPYSGRTSGVLRLLVYTWVFVAVGLVRVATAGASTFYVWVLWIVPLTTTFPFFLLLRDVYQHTNADHGRLT